MSKRTDRQTEQKVIEMYEIQNPDGTWVGANVVGEKFGVSPATVRAIIRRNGHAVRDNSAAHVGMKCKPVKNLPKDGEKPPPCKCGCGTPVNWRRSNNRWDAYAPGHYRKDAPYKHEDWLRQEYEIKHRTVMDIADQFGVGKKIVWRFMRKFGIDRRTTSDSLILNGSVSGANNPAWKGGVAKWGYAPNWKRIARKIRKRDNYTCQICGTRFPTKSKLLHVHHQDGDKFNNRSSNLLTVCATCHPKGKGNEGRKA